MDCHFSKELQTTGPIEVQSNSMVYSSEIAFSTVTKTFGLRAAVILQSKGSTECWDMLAWQQGTDDWALAIATINLELEVTVCPVS